jgi:hypothetical protein
MSGRLGVPQPYTCREGHLKFTICVYTSGYLSFARAFLRFDTA